MIDTSLIKTVEIDVDKCEGRFGAGLTWGELDAATQVHGLAVTGGRITHTGIAGYGDDRREPSGSSGGDRRRPAPERKR